MMTLLEKLSILSSSRKLPEVSIPIRIFRDMLIVMRKEIDNKYWESFDNPFDYTWAEYRDAIYRLTSEDHPRNYD